MFRRIVLWIALLVLVFSLSASAQEVLFEDDFTDPEFTRNNWKPVVYDANWAPNWDIDLDEQAFIEDGLLIIENMGTGTMKFELYTGDPTWVDYTVEIKMRAIYIQEHVGINVRAEMESQYPYPNPFTLMSRSGNLAWWTPQDSENGFDPEKNQMSHGFKPMQWYVVRIDVRGSTITVWVDDKFVGTVENRVVQPGLVGVYACLGNIEVDYVKIMK